jgi:DNA-directed RNA polymerase specialized sigma24 family protein
VNAYDDHGNRILAAGFEYPDDEPRPADTQPAGLEAALNLVASLADASPPATIGARLLMLSYLAKLPGHPRTQRELARRLGVSVSRVNRLLRNLRGNLKDLWLPSEQATHR